MLCEHDFCIACLTRISSVNEAAVTTTRCPMCRATQTGPLTPNRTIKTILELCAVEQRVENEEAKRKAVIIAEDKEKERIRLEEEANRLKEEKEKESKTEAKQKKRKEMHCDEREYERVPPTKGQKHRRCTSVFFALV